MNPIRIAVQALSAVALIATIVPSILYYNGSISLDTMKHAMLLATLAWFLTAPLWMGRTPDTTNTPQI